MSRNVFMPKRNSSETYVPFNYKDSKTPAIKKPYELIEEKNSQSIGKIPNTKELDLDIKNRVIDQRVPNKVQLAPLREPPRNPEAYRYFYDRTNRIQKAPVPQEQVLRPIQSLENNLLESYKNLELIDTMRKKSPIIQSKPILNLGQDFDRKNELKLTQDKKPELLRPGKFESPEFQTNLKKFFAAEEEDELPSHSEFRTDNKNLRFAKTNLKTIVHDPITGNTSNYHIERTKPRALGSKPPEIFPGKINDSPQQVKYELPKNTKKAPKNVIFNPLTHETVKIDSSRVSPYLDLRKIAN